MKSRPRILIVGPTPPPYHGVSVATHNLLESRLSEHFELILLDIADRRGLTNIGQFDWHNLMLALRQGLSFLRLLVLKRPQIVYICISQNTLGYLRDCLFLIPSRLLRRRVVIHLHGSAFQSFYSGSPIIFRWLIRWTLRGVSRAIVLSENLREMFTGLVPDNQIAVVANGLEPLGLADDQPELLMAEPVEQRRVLYLGTIMKAKGTMDVLRSVPLVLQEEPRARFTLAGELLRTKEGKEVETFVSENGLNDVVEMPYVIVGDGKTKLLRETDIFVFPPIEAEGQPLVILEAMSAGLPVISTPQGAIPETVIDGVNGFLVPPGDPTAIADKILLLLHDENLRNRMGQASRERFLDHYTLDRWVDDMIRLFREVSEEETSGSSREFILKDS